MDCTYTMSTNNRERTILKVSTPKGAYSKKELKELYEMAQSQVGDDFLPVIVPDDVTLEVIV